MLYPIKKYTDIQGWISETDADGVDIKDSYVSDCENIDFENAFMKNAIKPTEVSYPTLVDAYIIQGYEVLSLQYFNHETRGDTFFYILYKFTTVHLLKFIVKDDISTNELNIDEQNSDITFESKPTNIVFALADNQLKISLNINIIYNTLSKTVVGSLMLAYLKKKSYLDDVIDRAENWYLFPRWLGWTEKDAFVNSADVERVEDFEDSTLIDDLHMTFSTGFAADWKWETTSPLAGTQSAYLRNTDTTFAFSTAIHIGGALTSKPNGYKAMKSFKFLYKTIGTFGVGKILVEIVARKYKAGIPIGGTVVIHSEELETFAPVDTVEMPVNMIVNESDEYYIFTVDFTVPATGGGPTYVEIMIDDFTLIPYDGLNIVTKNFDGQRATLQETFAINFEDMPSLVLPITVIDWRTVEYEVYGTLIEDAPLVKMAEMKVDGNWVVAGLNITKEIAYLPTEEQTTTLVFNYGLKINIYPYSIDADTNIIGDNIFSEAYHKARTYYVKGDNKVYQSHISGTGRGQPDSFPFSIENQFGFFETFRSEKNYTVSVTPQDELVIGTKRKAYVYFIQGGRGVILRILRAINGGQSVIGSKAMLSDLEGQPEATVLAWFNEEGLYLSPGGRREPKDVIKATHKNYWLARTDKKEAVIFFNKAKKEVWIAFPNKEIIIYELDFNKWKKYKYDFAIVDFIGNIDNDLYVLGDDKKMYKIDFNSNDTLSGFIITHYSSDTLVVDRYPIPAPEHELKVLQELYIAFNKRSSGIFEYIIIADGNTYLPINMFPNNFTDLVLAPQLLVYGKVKIKLKIPAVGAWVREFGYNFSVLGRAPGQIAQPNKTGIGMNTGLQLGVHQ